MTQQEELEHLKKEFFSKDWERMRAAGYRLAEVGGDEVVQFLIPLLKTEDHLLRNCVALSLRDIKYNIAIDPLLEAIFKKENHNYNGTLVFALETLDCSQKLKETFKILFYESFEAKLSAYDILSEQVFEFTEDDLHEINYMWEDIKLHPDKCPSYEYKEVHDMLKDAVEGYISYLKEEKRTDR